MIIVPDRIRKIYAAHASTTTAQTIMTVRVVTLIPFFFLITGAVFAAFGAALTCSAFSSTFSLASSAASATVSTASSAVSSAASAASSAVSSAASAASPADSSTASIASPVSFSSSFSILI
ncbi:MAG: hypothetical protein E7233_11615 [Lachnospiraceae bacterium]|nr:hypothetical protein [Lachnospiraceae bacterium]